jgi:hypothetical protein
VYPARFASIALIMVLLLLATSSAAHASSPGRFTLAAAGDVACTPGEVGAPPNGAANGPDNCQQAGTAALIESLQPNAVAAVGDLQYNFGTIDEFNGSFASTWGMFKTKIYPAPGNHEWYDLPVNGAGYFDYFDGVGADTGRAGMRGKGYYSVNLNRRWHLITLNSNCTRLPARALVAIGSAGTPWDVHHRSVAPRVFHVRHESGRAEQSSHAVVLG